MFFNSALISISCWCILSFSFSLFCSFCISDILICCIEIIMIMMNMNVIAIDINLYFSEMKVITIERRVKIPKTIFNVFVSIIFYSDLR